MELRQAIAASLESGHYRGGAFAAAARAWGWVADGRIARPLVWEDGKQVLAIGGSTLGGSGKTPLALACASHLAERGVRATIVGHAYRASPGRPRVVSPVDTIAFAGDEAVMCARTLAQAFGERGRAEVIVAPSRQDALDFAFERGAEVAILDGIAQCTPRRATLSLLVVDGKAPWGSGTCPPVGDLRASISSLLAAADHVVRMGTDAVPASRGAWLGGELIPWSRLRTQSVGLVTALARPARVLSMLADHGVVPAQFHVLPDHASPAQKAALRAGKRLDMWIATAKCSVGLPSHIDGVPLATLEYAVTLGPEVGALLEARLAHNAAHDFASRRP